MFIMKYGKMLVFYTLAKVPLSLVGTLMDSAYMYEHGYIH